MRPPVPAKAPAAADGTSRLNKRMAELGLCSRREADDWIAQGWVKVNGEVAAMGEIADRIIGMIDRGAAIDARNRAERAEAQLALEGTKKRYVDGLAAAGERAVQAERPA